MRWQPGGRIKDVANTLVVHLPNTVLTSVTELQILNGGNHFAVGAHGRWEILSAQTIVEQADGSFYMSNLMRGRFGTEWAMTTHQAGDMVVHLDPALIEFVGLPISALNIQKNYRAVSRGELISSAIDVPYTWTGQNLKPLAPIYLNGNRHPTTGDWSLDWIYRTRTPVEPFSGISAPTGEAPLTWDVEFWSAGYSTLKRTQTGLSSAVAAYTAAQQNTDFAAQQETLYLKIYPVSPVVGRGYPLVTSITRQAVPDPNIALRFLASRLQGQMDRHRSVICPVMPTR